MGAIAEIQYNGEVGFRASIDDVRNFFKIVLDTDEWLDQGNIEKTTTNREIIFNTYNIATKILLNLADEEGNITSTPNDIKSDMPCPDSLVLYVDSDYISADILISQSNLLADNFSVTGYSDEKDKNFVVRNNKFYNEILKPSSFDTNPTSNLNDGIFAKGQRELPSPTFWLWSKALNEKNSFNNYSIFDLTPFVESAQLNMSESGGNFNISLLPIDGLFDLDENKEPIGIWKPDENKYVRFKEKGKTNFLFRTFLDKIGTRRQEDYSEYSAGERVQATSVNQLFQRDRKFSSGVFGFGYNRTETLFKNIIAENDIIFVSFDENREVPKEQDFFISNDELPNREWQMIGLVDSNNIGVTYENTERNLTIQGRDCMKLLIEDGSYFFAKSFADSENSDSVFGNVDLPKRGDDNNATNITIQNKDAKGINRLIASGLIEVLYNPEARNVNFVMNLLMSTLSNIEICHSELFAPYGDRRTEFTVTTIETTEVDKTEGNEFENLD